jgi:hypothetical protein
VDDLAVFEPPVEPGPDLFELVVLEELLDLLTDPVLVFVDPDPTAP